MCPPPRKPAWPAARPPSDHSPPRPHLLSAPLFPRDFLWTLSWSNTAPPAAPGQLQEPALLIFQPPDEAGAITVAVPDRHREAKPLAQGHTAQPELDPCGLAPEQGCFGVPHAPPPEPEPLPISLASARPCGYVMGASFFSFSFSMVSLSSRRSSLVPTRMMGVLGQWCRTSGNHWARAGRGVQGAGGGGGGEGDAGEGPARGRVVMGRRGQGHRSRWRSPSQPPRPLQSHPVAPSPPPAPVAPEIVSASAKATAAPGRPHVASPSLPARAPCPARPGPSGQLTLARTFS